MTFEAIYTVLPFGNDLVYKMMSGADLIRLLEQQWEAPLCQRDIIPLSGGNICGRLLQPSRSLRYTWDFSKGQGKPIGTGALLVPDSIKINEVALDRAKSYRVIISKFHAEGGDGFDVFTRGAPYVNWGGSDLAALQDYFDKTLRPGAAKISKPSARLTCLNCPAGIDALMNDPANGVCVKY